MKRLPLSVRTQQSTGPGARRRGAPRGSVPGSALRDPTPVTGSRPRGPRLSRSRRLPPWPPAPRLTLSYYFSSETFQSPLMAAVAQCKEKIKIN